MKPDLEVAREPAQARTPDGSPIGFYKLLPALGEPELVHSAIPAGATVLELGCGAGRITRGLIALGHAVTAVDSSPQMLAEVRAGETVLADVRELDLRRTFDCVLLMSNLVNAGDEDRRAFLRTCRRHVAPDGVVVIERMDPQPTWGSSEGEYGPFHIEVELVPDGDGLRGVVVYSLPDGRSWAHRFGPGGRILDDAALRSALLEAGLRLERIFGPKRRWSVSRPVRRREPTAIRHTDEVRKRKVAVLGATGTVGQRFISLLAGHPWFDLVALTGSDRSVGKRFGEAVHWLLPTDMPDGVRDMPVQPTDGPVDAEICFSALPSEAAETHEAALAKTGHHVFTNASTHRMDGDVPLMLAEVNFDHVRALEKQRRDRGWRGSIVANGNCTAIHLNLALAPLHRDFGIERAVVTTMQALSGASYPGVPSLDALDNVVPYINGEEEKVVEETNKFLGSWDGTAFVPAGIVMSVHCNRVTVRDGHTETVSLTLRGAPSVEEVKASLRAFTGRPQQLGLPTAPERPVIVRDEPDRPQPVLDRDVEKGMATTVGRVRPDPILGMKFVLLGHNTIRGAAGASVLNAELLVAEGCI